MNEKSRLTSILMCLAAFFAGVALSIWGMVLLKKTDRAPEVVQTAASTDAATTTTTEAVTTTTTATEYPKYIQEAKDRHEMLSNFINYINEERFRIGQLDQSKLTKDETDFMEMYRNLCNELLYLGNYTKFYDDYQKSVKDTTLFSGEEE